VTAPNGAEIAYVVVRPAVRLGPGELDDQVGREELRDAEK
jgi:hypothetical protein